MNISILLDIMDLLVKLLLSGGPETAGPAGPQPQAPPEREKVHEYIMSLDASL